MFSLIVGGLTVGSIYALIACGFVLIFKGTSLLNFAHGAMVLLGGYVAYEVAQVFGFWAALVVSAATVGVLGWIIQRSIFSRLKARPLVEMFMIALGLDVILFSLISGYRPWSVTPKSVPNPWGSDTIIVLGTNVRLASLGMIVISTVLLAGLGLYLRYSRTGLAMQVTSLDREVATILGVRVDRYFVVSWILAGALAGIAGAFLGIFPNLLEPQTHGIAMRALPAVILGGIDSVPGTWLAALLLGLFEVFTVSFAPDWIGDGFHRVMPYVIMFFVLLLRPQGFFGTREREVARL